MDLFDKLFKTVETIKKLKKVRLRKGVQLRERRCDVSDTDLCFWSRQADLTLCLGRILF